MSGLFITDERILTVDFSLPLYKDTIGLVFLSSDSPAAPNYWVYVDVFHATLWIGLVVVAICIAIGFMVVYSMSIGSSSSMVWRMILQLDCHVEAEAASKRLVNHDYK